MAVTPLGALIEECKALFLKTHGVELTNGDIARRGGKDVLTRQRVQQLEKDPIKRMPSVEILEALSRGLGVPESIVTQRAAVSAGYRLSEDYGLAARTGIPEKTRRAAAEPDPNVDPPGPDDGA
jgi:transcriptional regulator with XRE-family HTH domain